MNSSKRQLKIGILQCDDVLENFQPQFGTYPGMLISLFQMVRPQYQFEIYDVREEHYPTDIHDCDAYVTTGCRHGVNDELIWLASFLDFIRKLHEQKKACIGICFGHQAIAKALDGEVRTSEKGWGIGLSTNEKVTNTPWMQPPCNPLKIVVSHKDQVMRIPREAIVLYRSDFCPNYMIQVDQHFLSVQGHPEFSKDYSKALMQYRKDTIAADVIDAGFESLEHKEDNIVFAQWMAQFIEQAIKQ